MQKLKSKNSIIPFKVEDYQGNIINTENYKEKKILISFFRDASCTFCNIRLNQLISKYDELRKKNIELICFFASSKEDILEYAQGQKAAFPIIPDPNFNIYEKYGVEKSLKAKVITMFQFKKIITALKSKFFNPKSFNEANVVPADFMIDEQGIIQKAHYGKNFGDHISVQEIIDWKLN